MTIDGRPGQRLRLCTLAGGSVRPPQGRDDETLLPKNGVELLQPLFAWRAGTGFSGLSRTAVLLHHDRAVHARFDALEQRLDEVRMFPEIAPRMVGPLEIEGFPRQTALTPR